MRHKYVSLGLEGELLNIEVMVTMCENCHMEVDHFVDKITKKLLAYNELWMMQILAKSIL